MSTPGHEDPPRFRDGLAAIVHRAGVPIEFCQTAAAEIADYIGAWIEGGHRRAGAYLAAQYGRPLRPAAGLQPGPTLVEHLFEL